MTTFSHLTSEIWSRNNGMLGGSSKLVYMHLSNVPSKVSQLSNITGKCRNTVLLALDKLGDIT